MIKINELYSLENISDCYYVNDNHIKNTYGILRIEIIEDRRSRDYRKDIYLA